MQINNHSSDIVAIALCSFVLGVLVSISGLANTVLHIKLVIRLILGFLGL